MKKIKKINSKINFFLENIKKNNISEFAAQGAYYIILSFIPFLILLLTLIQYIGIDKQNLYFIIKTIIPNTMNETIVGIIQEVYTKSIGTISISIIFVLWASGKGFYSLCKGLQNIYEIEEKTTYFYLKIKSIMYTVGFIILIILALVLIVFGQILADFLIVKFSIRIDILSLIIKFSDIIVTIVLFIFLLLVYKFIPQNKNKLKKQIPGAVIASIGWVIISKIFSVYLTIFKGFSIMYGSLTTIVLIMMWVYFCMYIILIGAQINNLI